MANILKRKFSKGDRVILLRKGEVANPGAGPTYLDTMDRYARRMNESPNKAEVLGYSPSPKGYLKIGVYYWLEEWVRLLEDDTSKVSSKSSNCEKTTRPGTIISTKTGKEVKAPAMAAECWQKPIRKGQHDSIMEALRNACKGVK